MTVLPDPSRRAAHVILDTVTSLDRQADFRTNRRALITALEGLQATGAVSVHDSADPTDDVRVDVSELVLPVIIMVERLAEELALERGEDELAVIAGLREYIDELPRPTWNGLDEPLRRAG